MREFELAFKAVGDPTRTRILKLLEGRGLCVCQVQTVLRLAPSTVSKHLAILKNAGLVGDQRNGKWIEYTLVPDQNPYARGILGMLRGALDRDPVILADRKRLREVLAVPLEEVCGLPVSRREVALRRRPGGLRRKKVRYA